MGTALNRLLVEGLAMRASLVDFRTGINELLDTRRYPPGAQKAALEGVGRVAVAGAKSLVRERILL